MMANDYVKVDRPNTNINLEACEDLLCVKCGNATFEEVRLIKKVSALMSPTGKAGLVPIPTFACAACGVIPAEFLKKKLDSV